MALSTASRFAVLKIEEEDEDEVQPNKAKKTNVKKQPLELKKKQQQQQPAKKNKQSEQRGGVDLELKKLAFGTSKTKKHNGSSSNASTVNNRKKEKIASLTEESHDETWLKKNEEIGNRLFEEDIQQAIYLSKLDYEENREIYEARQQEALEAKQAEKKKKKAAKKEKSPTMTLGEFNNLLPSQINRLPAITEQINEPEKNFFEETAQYFQQIMSKENHKMASRNAEVQVPTDVRLLQLQDELEKKEIEIQNLIKERDKLQEENREIKEMNSKFCSLLSSGPLKEKSDALMQVDELLRDKDELTQELVNLHAALEQERSKVHGLQQQVLRFQGNRKEFK